MITKFKIFENLKQQVLDVELYNHAKKISSLQYMRDLIKKGANVNFANDRGHTALMRAAFFGFFSGVKLLIENGAKVNMVNDDGFSAIIQAVVDKYSFQKHKRYKDIVDILIENGADLNIKNSKGQDMFDINNKLHEYISNKFPKEYEEYLIKKESERYNI